MPKSLDQLLDEYERDILMRMDPVRKEMAVLERELADVRKARNAITVDREPASVSAARMVAQLVHQNRLYHFGGGDGQHAQAAPSPYDKLTMKQLICKALTEHFENGATANELLDFFENAYGRNDIVRTSLSPQLSRLKRVGSIALHGVKWRLAKPDDHNENGALALLLSAPEADRVAAQSNHQPETTDD